MTESKLNYYQVVNESLTGQRSADEETFTSLGVLTERLEQLKKKYGFLKKVDFSPEVKKLSSYKNPVVVG